MNRINVDILRDIIGDHVLCFVQKAELEKAIEKQIPKKPKILTYQLLIDSGWKHGCPNCGCAVGINKNLGFAYGEYLEPYESCCCSCGQALDWSVLV